MKLPALMLIALAVAACGKEPVARSKTDNSRVEVETLFGHDGCTVYRFHDYGRAVYFARCAESTTASLSHHESCGKGCRRTVLTTTQTRPQ